MAERVQCQAIRFSDRKRCQAAAKWVVGKPRGDEYVCGVHRRIYQPEALRPIVAELPTSEHQP